MNFEDDVRILGRCDEKVERSGFFIDWKQWKPTQCPECKGKGYNNWVKK